MELFGIYVSIYTSGNPIIQMLEALLVMFIDFPEKMSPGVCTMFMHMRIHIYKQEQKHI